MRISLILVALALSFCFGCRKSPATYGNFAQVESVELVQDAVTILLVTYPPAKTRLNLLQATDDSFGFRLIEAMRGNGYAVAEYATPGKGDTLDTASGLAFAYILDRLKDGGELRVTLYVGDETINRLYAVNGAEDSATYIPTGSWVRRQ